MIENTVVYDENGGDVVQECDKNKYAASFMPKGYARVATVEEQPNPTPNDGPPSY